MSGDIDGPESEQDEEIMVSEQQIEFDKTNEEDDVVIKKESDAEELQ